MTFLYVNKCRRPDEVAFIIHWITEKGVKKKSRYLTISGVLRLNTGLRPPPQVLQDAIKAIAKSRFGKQSGVSKDYRDNLIPDDAYANETRCTSFGAC